MNVVLIICLLSTIAFCTPLVTISHLKQRIDQHAAVVTYLHQQHLFHNHTTPPKKEPKRNWFNIVNTSINVGILCLACYKMIELYKQTFTSHPPTNTPYFLGFIPAALVPHMILNSANNVTFLQQAAILLGKMFCAKLILKGILLCAFYL